MKDTLLRKILRAIITARNNFCKLNAYYFIGNVVTYRRRPLRYLTSLFDEYGPVVRFVSPIGRDIVLINHPDHIQKVYAMEGDQPVRSTLDCLEKYRAEHRHHVLGGLFSMLVFTVSIDVLNLNFNLLNVLYFVDAVSYFNNRGFLMLGLQIGA